MNPMHTQTFHKTTVRAAIATLVATFVATLPACAQTPVPVKPATIAVKMTVIRAEDIPTPGKEIVLFSGEPTQVTANWVRLGGNIPADWKVSKGAMVSRNADIATRQLFRDFMLHIEYKTPVYGPEVHGQERGNSGVYLQGRYEIQVLDSYPVADPGKGDGGAVYDQSAPLLKAYKPATEWQTYDIIFRAPRVDSGNNVTEKARVTVLLNGIVIQNNTEIQGVTGGSMDNNVGQPGPIRLQFHGHAVQYRNVRITPLPEKGANHY